MIDIINIFLNSLYIFFFVFVRMSGFFIVLLIFGRRNIFVYFKIGFVFFLSLFVVIIYRFFYSVFVNLFEYIFVVIKEFIVGFLIGYILYMVFLVIFLVG